MNKQIQALMDQAGTDTSGKWMSVDNAERFAELIVRECCDIFVELRTRPADLAVKDVKKHFGVDA